MNKIQIAVTEEDSVQILRAIGVAYHQRDKAGETEDARTFSGLDSRVRSAVAAATAEAAQAVVSKELLVDAVKSALKAATAMQDGIGRTPVNLALLAIEMRAALAAADVNLT